MAYYNNIWEIYGAERLKAAIMAAYGQTGAGTEAWMAMNNKIVGMSDAEIYKFCSNLSGTDIITNGLNAVYPTPVNGTFGMGARVSSSYAGAAESAINAAAELNSNTIAARAQTMELTIPASAVKTGQQVAFETGSKVVSTGSKLETVLGHAATALLGVGIGSTLGVWIDGAIYNISPDFWDEHNLSELNPETWTELKIGQALLQHASYPTAPVLVDKNGQMYCDENMFAMLVQYMAANGIFNDGRIVVDNDVPSGELNNTYNFTSLTGAESLQAHAAAYPDNHNYQVTLYSGSATMAFIEATNVSTAAGDFKVFAASTEPFTLQMTRIYISPPADVTRVAAQKIYSKNGDEFYYAVIEVGAIPFVDTFSPSVNRFTCSNSQGAGMYADLAYILCNGTEHEQQIKNGVHPYDTMPQGITPDMSLADIINAIKQQYPDLADQELKNSVLQPDGSIVDYYYLPVSVPEGGTEKQPTSKPENKGAVDPKNIPQSERLLDTQIPPSTNTPSTDDRGKGNTPTVVTPTGAADALYAIYNPTLAEVKSLGAWLWSSNFIDQILKLFSSPMEAIISLHKIYGTPHTSGTQNIKVGYLDSGVSAKVVDQQYINIDCGSVNVKEAFGGVFDYNPFSEISLYLPFIGIVSLDIADVMRGSVKVIYHIDVITGAVLAEVHITRDSAGGVIYQYTGSCAEHFPLSAGSYVGVVAGMAGIAAGVAGTVATGGSMAPALLGAGAGIGAMHTNISKSGNFTANAGAMGIKKPYLIISRPQTAMAANFEHMSGLGANTYCTLASCKGFARVKFIHLDNVEGATKQDLDDIRTKLKEGVIV